MHVRRWETHLKPRAILIDNAHSSASDDIFGEINGIEKIDKGWLTNETILQFKFFNNPFALRERIKKRLLYVKVRIWLHNQYLQANSKYNSIPHYSYLQLTAMNLRINDESQNMLSNFEESLSNDTRDNNSEQAYAFSEVATLNSLNYSFEQQSQFGRAYEQNDILLFNITVTEPENVAYLIDLYTYSSKAIENEPPYHLGL